MRIFENVGYMIDLIDNKFTYMLVIQRMVIFLLRITKVIDDV